jgi:hypothetical protein
LKANELKKTTRDLFLPNSHDPRPISTGFRPTRDLFLPVCESTICGKVTTRDLYLPVFAGGATQIYRFYSGRNACRDLFLPSFGLTRDLFLPVFAVDLRPISTESPLRRHYNCRWAEFDPRPISTAFTTLPRDLEPGLFGMIRWPPLHRLGACWPLLYRR